MKRLAIPLVALVLVLLSGWVGWETFVRPRAYVPRTAPPVFEGGNAGGTVSSPPIRLVVDPPSVASGRGAGLVEDETEVAGEEDEPTVAVTDVAVGEPAAVAVPVIVSTPGPAPRPADILDGHDPWLLHTSGTADPLGVREVKGGLGWIGTPLKKVQGWAVRAGDLRPEALFMEVPRHRVAFDPFGIAPYETNQQSWRSFLQDTGLVWIETPYGDAETLADVVTLLAGPRAPEPWDLAATVVQCYVANEGALHDALGDQVVEASDGRIDLEATRDRFARRSLPAGIRLRFYERPPPRHWEGLDPPAGTEDHPVRDVSPADAVAYAWWSGLCLPSEEQWEYASRGPNGWAYPWGNGGASFDDWVNGGHAPPRGEVPRTVSARALLDGASWVGALNTLGNVSEWTSSWLDPYPDSILPGRLVPVFRGGSAADEERVLVRPAFRGWEAGSETPHWRGRRPWTGLRMARLLPEFGSNAVVNMHMEARVSGRVGADLLQDDVHDTAVGRILKRYDEAAVVPSLRRGVKTFSLQPLARVATMDLDTGLFRPGLPEDVHSREDLVALSVSGTPVLLGLVRVGLGLEGVWREREGERRGDRLILDPAFVEAGTWWIGLVHGRAALLDMAMKRARYLTRTVAPSAVLNVRKASGRGRAALDPDPESALVGVLLEVPVGRAGRSAAVVRLRTRFVVLPSLRAKVPRWIQLTSR